MKILFFAQTKDAAGSSELEMTVQDNVSVEELWKSLVEKRPALSSFQKTTRLARNGEYTNPATRFLNSDEVALIPPVSGG